MKVYLKRVKKGEECNLLVPEGGYVPGYRAETDGYVVSINYKGAFISEEDMKLAREKEGELVQLRRYDD